MIGPAVALAIAPVGAVLAEASSGSFDPFTIVGSIVTPVIVVVLLLVGKLHTENDYKRLELDLEAERAERLRLQTALTDRVIPALTRSSLVLETLAPVLQNEVRLHAALHPDLQGE